jgi:hypothetical protein
MGNGQECYLSYLLRLWQAKSGGKPVWRASLEDAHTSKRTGFACLDDLVDFLREQIGEEPRSPESSDDGCAERTTDGETRDVQAPDPV